MNTITNTTIEDCQERFIMLSSRFGYKRGLRELQKEFSPETISAFATSSKAPNPEGQRESTEAVRKASSRWAALFENTEGRR